MTRYIEVVTTTADIETAATIASEAIRRLLAYDEPEIVATSITVDSASYLRWLDDELNQ